MTDMIERVARAIAHSLHEPPDAWVHWQAEAHAAIAAMRVPTETMIAAANRNNHPRDIDTWQTMIDAALAR